MHNVYQEDSDFMKSLFSFIEEERFTVNPEKTRLQKRGERQEVTGLTVNDKVNTAHKYTRELRNILYMWEKYGYKDAYASFYRHYKATKGHVKKGEPVLENVIVGKLDFLKMVKGENDAVYIKLCSRFEALNPSLYDSKKTNEKKVNYIVSYSTAKFERVFNTKVKFIMNSEGELSAVCKMGKKEYSICISSAVKDIVLTEKAKPRKNYRFTIHSLGGFYIALCRSHSVNYWMLLTNEPTRDTHVHPKYNNLPIDQLLQEWEEKGLEAAVEQFLSILEGLSVQRQKQKVEPNLPSLGEKKCKKKKSSNVFKEDLMIEDYMDYMDFQASLIDFEDEETIEYNTAAIKKFLNREKDGKED